MAETAQTNFDGVGVFKQLFSPVRGEFEQRFSKISNTLGVVRGGGGMLKLRFDWYIRVAPNLRLSFALLDPSHSWYIYTGGLITSSCILPPKIINSSCICEILNSTMLLTTTVHVG